MFPRIREITDAFGARLRVSIEAHPTGALVVFDRPDRTGYPRAVLDGYGAEVLCGYIIAARLALPNALPDEIVEVRRLGYSIAQGYLFARAARSGAARPVPRLVRSERSAGQ